MCDTEQPVIKLTPFRWCRAATTVPISSPNCRARGTAAASTTVTFAPADLAVEATSAPIKPAPMTTTSAPGCSVGRRAAASCKVRSVCTRGKSRVPAMVRGEVPVAMTKPSKLIDAPVSRCTSCRSRSRPTADTPEMNETSSAARRGSAGRRASCSGVRFPSR